ncbi:MAG TPA: metal ABC transporter substrate-binding protein [Candidatus Limnocylindrales bacterium]|nr:metal ABC transporter substrate-binding protein [Candidatus Limnocylindrales bacterium]
MKSFVYWKKVCRSWFGWGFMLFLILGLTSISSLAAEKKLKVVTTVAPLTNLVKNVGGSRIDLHGIIPEGTDSHTFEPRPSDISYIAAADLIILNGLHLETPTEKLIEANGKPGVVVLKLGDNTITEKDWIFDFSFPKEQGDPNPHLWLNVPYTMKYVELIRDKLIALDPENKDFFAKNAEVYLEKLKQLDKEIEAAVQTIPPQNRKLLTYHDSWAYFARRYGMTVIGAIQPASFSEPSPQEVARLIDQIKKEKVPAIFGSEVFPSKVLDQIGREAGVKYIDTLRDDDLPGPVGSPEHTYIGMMIEDVRTMVSSLGGDPKGLDLIDPADLNN